MEDTKRRRSNERPGASQRYSPPVCRHRSHTGGTGWVTAKHESVPDRAPTRRSDGRTCGSDLLIYCIARIGRALSWQRNIDVQGRSSRTAAADGRLLRKVIGSNEGTGAQRIDRSRAPSARTLAVDSRWPPPWGLPSKGTAAEDTQSCTRTRTIRLLKIAVWKIQRDGGATSALARAKDTPDCAPSPLSRTPH